VPISSIDQPWIGYASFCGIKFVGYSLAAHRIRLAYSMRRNPLIVGGTRTLIGMAVGALYFFTMRTLVWTQRTDEMTTSLIYMGLLIPIRFVEWWALIGIFFDYEIKRPLLGWKVVALGTLWSFALDFPAALGFCLTGGITLC
jgi:hypothetical protein